MLKVAFEEAYATGELPLDRPHEWHQADARIPKLQVTHDGDPHFKTVQELDADRTEYADAAVIFLVRDPRDVMVSLFFEMTRRTRFYEDWGFDTSRVTQHADDLSRFIRGPVGRLETLLAYYRLWDQVRHHVSAFHLVSYESLHADAVGVLDGVLTFMNAAISHDLLEVAVERCRFDRMKALEARDAFASPTLAAADKDDPESFKVRRGKVAGYRDYMRPDDIAWLDARCADLPDLFASYRKAPR